MKAAVVAVVAAVLAALGPEAAPEPAAAGAPAGGTAEAPPQSPPEAPAAATPPEETAEADLDPACAALLDEMDATGRKLKTVRARFDYELHQTLFDDVKRRKGMLAFRAPNHLRFEFTGRDAEAFIFNGRILYHRQDASKQLHVWEIRRADEPPVESFQLGKTPFPMPFGQRKETVLKYFEAKCEPGKDSPGAKEPSALVLTPKKGTELGRSYTRIKLWIDPETHLPTKARLWDPSENITTIAFEEVRTNEALPPETFDRPEVPAEWDVIPHRREAADPAAGEEAKQHGAEHAPDRP